MERVGKYDWKCLCDCGNTTFVKTHLLTSGATKSCGCYMREKASKINRTHGQTQTKLYKVWSEMKRRCDNPHDNVYKHYGGRGISYADEWKHFEPFYEWALTNGYREAERGKYTLDRINVNGNYEPSNCRWISHAEQMGNKRAMVRYSFRGQELTVRELSNLYGIKPETIRSRIKYYGMTVEEAATTPVRGG